MIIINKKSSDDGTTIIVSDDSGLELIGDEGTTLNIKPSWLDVRTNSVDVGTNYDNSDSTATHCTFLGNNAGLNNYADGAGAGNRNTYIGADAGKGGVTGSTSHFANTAVGNRAMESVVGGYRNTALGYITLGSMSVGDWSGGGNKEPAAYNVALGAFSMQNCIGGHSNMAQGYGTMIDSRFPTRNVAIGRGAGWRVDASYSTITAIADAGGGNIEVTSAGHGLSNGDEIAICGTTSYNTVTDNEQSVTVANVTTDTFEVPGIFVADDATGYWYKTEEGTGNVLIGYRAGVNVTTGSKNVFIGFKAGEDETGSNKLYIANSDTASPLIGGDFSAGSVTINSTLDVITSATIGTLSLSDGSITDSGGTIDFGDENLTTTGDITGAAINGAAINGTSAELGTLVLSDGSITDSSGEISFGSNNLTTTGTLTTGDSITFGAGTGDVTISFDGNDNDSTIVWWSDENYLAFSDVLLVQDAIYFSQTDGAEKIESTADGLVTLSSGTKIMLDAGVTEVTSSGDSTLRIVGLTMPAIELESDSAVCTIHLSGSDIEISATGTISLLSNVIIGDGSCDPSLGFNGTTDGSILWNCSNSRFTFSDPIFVNVTDAITQGHFVEVGYSTAIVPLSQFEQDIKNTSTVTPSTVAGAAFYNVRFHIDGSDGDVDGNGLQVMTAIKSAKWTSSANLTTFTGMQVASNMGTDHTGDITDVYDYRSYSFVNPTSKAAIDGSEIGGSITNGYNFHTTGVQNCINGYGIYIGDIKDNTTANYAIYTNDGTVHLGDTVEIADGKNIVLDTTTGTKIGTSTSQKIGFYNATPVDQPATVVDPSGVTTDEDTEARTAIEAIIDRLQELGLIA